MYVLSNGTSAPIVPRHAAALRELILVLTTYSFILVAYLFSWMLVAEKVPVTKQRIRPCTNKKAEFRGISELIYPSSRTNSKEYLLYD